MTRRVLRDYPDFSIEMNDCEGKLDFAEIFGRSAAVHIEIGCGKGTFLLNEAGSHPEFNFLGVEQANKYYRYSLDRIGRWGLKNVRVVRAEAARFLDERIADGCVCCFHIYFPDPWPKRRHHKRRFFSSSNLDELVRCLEPGGTIKVATDHKEYFEEIQHVIAARGGRLRQIGFFPVTSAGPGEWVGTNFERKYLKEQRPIYTIAVEKA